MGQIQATAIVGLWRVVSGSDPRHCKCRRWVQLWDSGELWVGLIHATARDVGGSDCGTLEGRRWVLSTPLQGSSVGPIVGL